MSIITANWNRTKTEYPGNVNLITLIEQQVIKTPEKIACYFGLKSLTFKELNEKANQLAHFIKSHLKEGNKYIVIYLDRSIESIIAILAILKTGNIYVPIDVNTPLSYTEQIITECEASAIITNSGIVDNLSYKQIVTVNLQKNSAHIKQMPKTNLQFTEASKLIYVLYTSGTTGVPKGVKIYQKSLINLLFAMQKEINFSANERFLAITPITFDIATVEFYLPLICGASFVFADTETRYNPLKIIKTIEDFKISVMQATPITWLMLMNAGWQNPWKIKMLSGGEGLSSFLADKLLKTEGSLWNFYGPTETTVWSTIHKVTKIDLNKPLVAIGKPLANTKIFILDENLDEVPVGKYGELYIGGDGVAEGYLKNPELTNNKFILTKLSNDKLYKTGDMVYLDNENQLNFVGRIDTQIKIRGQRIEIEAIESIIIKHSAIKECAIVADITETDQMLTAYIVLTSDVSLEEINAFVSLHSYSPILPNRYIVLKELPLTAHGKIDRKKISLHPRIRELQPRTETSHFPENQLETLITNVISDYFKKDNRPSSNPKSNVPEDLYGYENLSSKSTMQFTSTTESKINKFSKFEDIGLHSLGLVHLANKLNKLLNISINVIDLINYPSITSFAKFLSKNQKLDSLEQGFGTKSSTKINSLANTSKPYSSQTNQDIAIIGMSCKFPGANNYHEYWNLILHKKNTISFFSKEELLNSGININLINDEKYVPARGILADIDKFDANFFNITPAEARLMDPQHRIILEQSWAALEDAGYVPENFFGKIGVFVGSNDSSYLHNQIVKNSQIIQETDQQQIMLANSAHYLATRISYILGLSGPSMTISTACSTGLVTVNMAVESLNQYNSDMAIAGAVNINVPQKSGYIYRELGILAPDGQCNVFAENSQGTVISNGVGIIVLKRLNDALRDNDNIIAVIKGSAINNDGQAKSAFTAPSIDAQALCIKEAIKNARIDPAHVEFIEAHGTGTIVGDPIEIAALTAGYNSATLKKGNYCAIGSVKSNIGHTDTASGIAGLIKASLALYHKTIPANINYKTNNQQIDFHKTPFYVSTDNSNWVTKHPYRLAGVNSLGFGGTNAHVILQEAPKTPQHNPAKSANVLIISAKTRSSLNQNIANIKEYLIKNVDATDSTATMLADCAYTLQLGRKHFTERMAIPFLNYQQLIKILSSTKETNKYTASTAPVYDRKIVFGFVGQGQQYVNMAYDLYKEQPFFQETVDECCKLIKEIAGFELKNILFTTGVNHPKNLLAKTEYAQPAIFVIGYGIAKLLINFGIKPTAMIGHSLGEYIAAAISGVFNLKDAIKLVVGRAKLMEKTKPGVMLAIPLPTAEIIPYLDEDIDIAAQNAPSLCVVSGPKKSITTFIEKIKPLLNSRQLNYQYLHISRAFHSQYMEPILDEFLDTVKDINFDDPQIPFISNLSGNWITAETIKSPNYWATHMRNSVLFSDGIECLKLSNDDIFIEIGPGKSLSQLVEHHIGKTPNIFNTLPNFAHSNLNSYQIFLATISKLWLLNYEINWQNLYQNEFRKKARLPTYAFAKQSYWLYPSIYNKKPIENNLFIPSWQRESNFKLNLRNNPKDNKFTWLVFSQDKNLQNILRNSLTRDLQNQPVSTSSENQNIYHIYLGDTFSQIDAFTYTINPRIKNHYVKLLKQINLSSQILKVIHTNLLDNQLSTVDNIYFGAYCLLYLTQAFSEVFVNKELHTLIITQNLYNVIGNENINPAKANILGPCKVIPQETPNIKMKLIDVTSEHLNEASLSKIIYSEAYSIVKHNFKDEIAYRGNFRWLQTLRPLNEQQITNQDRIKYHGTYIITGGLGGLGLAFAEFLAKEYHANIILISRTATKDADTWQTYIDDVANIPSPEYKKIKSLLKIKNHAKSLLIYNISISNKMHLQQTIQNIKQQYTRINGVIHAAGVPGMGVYELKTLEEYTKILEPKLYGTEYLLEFLANEDLDFFACFSSITSITGFPGQIDYCSANRILDAYAIKASEIFKKNVFSVSINWQAWRSIGMAAASETMLIDLNETNSLNPSEGCKLFQKIINGNNNQVIVSNTDLNDYDPEKLNLIPAIKTTISKNTSQIEESSYTINTLIDIWKSVIGISKISIDDDFYDLGGNSLLAISLIAKIRSRFTLNIPSTLLFKERTIRSIATIIEKNKSQLANKSPIIQLRKGITDKAPIFFIHPIGGTAFCYIELSNHLKTESIYAIQDPSIEYQKNIFKSIEEQAKFYLASIQKIQNKGPYYLCGSSFGASVVMEIAHLLEQNNETINFLGLLDGWAYTEDKSHDKAYVQSLIAIHTNHKEKILDDEKRQFFETLIAERLKILAQHNHKQLNTQISLFKANDLLPEYESINKQDNYWSRFSCKSINTFNIPGDHNTMLQGKNAMHLANKILEVINTTPAEISLETCS